MAAVRIKNCQKIYELNLKMHKSFVHFLLQNKTNTMANTWLWNISDFLQTKYFGLQRSNYFLAWMCFERPITEKKTLRNGVNRPISKSHNASIPYPTIHHFITEMCTCVHISVAKWCIVTYSTDALCDFWDGSIGRNSDSENDLRRVLPHAPTNEILYPQVSHSPSVNEVFCHQHLRQEWLWETRDCFTVSSHTLMAGKRR